MNSKMYPEVADFRGFGWILDGPRGRLRVLGMAGTAVRVEYLDFAGRAGDRPRAWLALAELPALARSLARSGMLDAVPEMYRAEKATPAFAAAPLFRQA